MDYNLHTNYTNICRTCLTENSNMKYIFNFEEIMEQEVMLCDMLMSCASILVIHGDGLPEHICLNCFQQVNTAYLFRKLCERSDVALRECTTFTTLSGDQSNIFTIPVNENKFFINLEEKSVDKDSFLNSDAENEYKETIIIDNRSCGEELESSVDDNPADYADVKEISAKETKECSLPTRIKTYHCKKCNELCVGLRSLRTHRAKVHGEAFRCEQCGKEFNAKNILVRHLLSNHNSAGPKRQRNKTGIIKKRNLPRTCDICNKTFRFHSNLERHKLIHTGEKPYLCNVCGKGFAQMAYLKIHSFIHTGEKPYKCQMCERSFAAPGTLMTHIRTHTGERPHICKICGKDFPQSGYLSAHIRTHTGEKPVECKVCNRRFNQSGRLIIHMRIHSGEKPYQCKDCGRSFAVKGTLKKHIRTHTGERPYMCKMCGQTFAQSGTLATHMKVHKPKAESDSLRS